LKHLTLKSLKVSLIDQTTALVLLLSAEEA
jgi:hypothetical protein